MARTLVRTSRSVTRSLKTQVVTLGASVTAGTFTLSWGADAAGFTLQSSASLGATASWSAVNGVANPLPGAGTANVTVPAGAGTRYYRMVK